MTWLREMAAKDTIGHLTGLKYVFLSKILSALTGKTNRSKAASIAAAEASLCSFQISRPALWP
jgi:hypothetical protein